MPPTYDRKRLGDAATTCWPWLVCGCLLVGLASAQEDERRIRSREIAEEFQRELGGRLMSAIAAGGPAGAIGICNIDAPGIAARLSEETGARVGRTALRLRNPRNAPGAGARDVLVSFERQIAGGVTDPPEHFAVASDGGARYMKAIVTQPLCLTCHGSELAPEVTARIAEHYPMDQATGFATGDLRGAFLIEWSVPGETD